MTTTIDRVTELFADARALYSDALEMLAENRIRNAAEKAWGATKRSTDAMVLARTGREPQSAGAARRASAENEERRAGDLIAFHGASTASDPHCCMSIVSTTAIVSRKPR